MRVVNLLYVVSHWSRLPPFDILQRQKENFLLRSLVSTVVHLL